MRKFGLELQVLRNSALALLAVGLPVAGPAQRILKLDLSSLAARMTVVLFVFWVLVPFLEAFFAVGLLSVERYALGTRDAVPTMD